MIRTKWGNLPSSLQKRLTYLITFLVEWEYKFKMIDDTSFKIYHNSTFIPWWLGKIYLSQNKICVQHVHAGNSEYTLYDVSDDHCFMNILKESMVIRSKRKS